MKSLAVRDTVRECLEKDPSDRTEDDIETLLEFTKNLKAFTNMTLTVRRALCSVMVFAVVERGGTMVMNDGEELDSWSVLINGHVEIEHSNGEKQDLQVGDSFGILPTMDTLYHRGVMRTKCDDCQFVCITQTDYYRIQHQGEENIKKHEENGVLVLVTELRHGASEGAARRGHVVIRVSNTLQFMNEIQLLFSIKHSKFLLQYIHSLHIFQFSLYLQGTPDRLMLQLIEENSMTDPTYVEDFLLTYRTFISNSQEISKQLLEWFENETAMILQCASTPSEIRDRVTRVVLLWVNNHFTDFESDPQMMKFLEVFEAELEKKNMLEQLHLLHIACAAKARNRVVTLTRSSRDEDLHFKIIGGYENGGQGIFINHVDKGSKAEEIGLKRGDQIIEVNGRNFEHLTRTGAHELMTGTTHLSITVKSNLLLFKDVLLSADSSNPRARAARKPALSLAEAVKLNVGHPRIRLSSVDGAATGSLDQIDCTAALPPLSLPKMTAASNANKKEATNMSIPAGTQSTNSTKVGGGFRTLTSKRRIQKALIKMNLYPKNSGMLLLDSEDQQSGSTKSSSNTLQSNFNSSTTTISNISTGSNDSKSSSKKSDTSNAFTSKSSGGAGHSVSTQSIYHSHSNPDLTASYHYEDLRASDYPEHVLKVYKADQSCKYLLIHKETTAHEVVMLALQEFGIHETSSNFSLCEVSVGEGGMIKQKRLPDQMQNLAERIGLAARYYLKTNGITETLVPDDMAPDLVRESVVMFLQLSANEVAIQLTVQDFAIFRQIESTEYVDDLFEIKSKYGVPMLKPFSELVNKEMFWVVTEVCSEYNIVRRMKIVKQFIKIARHCKECKNFNSMFAILSGLGHAAVSRLRLTWEKLPSKYQKLFTDLQEFMDPSRNMSKYRQLVLTELMDQQPIIPFFPIVKKDLTFIHLGNDTYVEALINFEKLRMIAKEIRSLTHMCSSPYDLLTVLEHKGQTPTSAMVALNQMSTSSNAGVNNFISAQTGSIASTLSNIASVATGQATVKRRKKSAAAPNPKKMFEEAQMVRRVKAYLNNIKVISEEEQLHLLSLECEPSGGSAPNTVTIRKRHPSPTLSTTSSTSSTSEGRRGHLISNAHNAAGICGPPKFGAASPQSVKKILSLSEQTKTRPHQPRHHGLPSVAAFNQTTAGVGNIGGLPSNHTIAHHPIFSPSSAMYAHAPIHHLNYVSGVNTNQHPIRTTSNPSPLSSPGAHRRIGSSSSAGIHLD